MTEPGDRTPDDKLEALARLSSELAAAATVELDARISQVLGSLERWFGYAHTMLFVPSDDAAELSMLACHGYPGGVGTSMRFGEGLIGVCAERRRAMRINAAPRNVQLAKAARAGLPDERTIPWPGLPKPGSQAAVAALVDERLALVLYAEDASFGRFAPDDSHTLQIVANLLATAIRDAADEETPAPVTSSSAPKSTTTLRVRYYESDGSVFFDDEYVIKSLPGRILFRLLRAQRDSGRSEFTKKELRLDESLKLPPVRDNLDTRLILLRRRLAERFPFVQLTPVARGRFLLHTDRPFELVEATASYF